MVFVTCLWIAKRIIDAASLKVSGVTSGLLCFLNKRCKRGDAVKKLMNRILANLVRNEPMRV